MSESEPGTDGEEKVKRTRNVRPIFLMVPDTVQAEGPVTYKMFRCKGLPEVRKCLADEGLDPTDERVEGLILLRGEEMDFKVSSQVVFKFGKDAAD